ncbi:MAG: hypothetical protein GX222_00050 [Ruminococcaceae bacterium]|nr:hypothetical protein [Oscillospiraceae bacterium]
MVKALIILGEFVILFLAVWCITFISLTAHELGHAFAYTLATRDNDWTIRVGNGKKLLETKRFIIKLVVFTGCFQPKTERHGSGRNTVIMLIGGPLVSFFLVVVLSVIRFLINIETSNSLSISAIYFLLNYSLIHNLLLFITSVLPIKTNWPIRGYVSDGYKIRKILSE